MTDWYIQRWITHSNGAVPRVQQPFLDPLVCWNRAVSLNYRSRRHFDQRYNMILTCLTVSSVIPLLDTAFFSFSAGHLAVLSSLLSRNLRPIILASELLEMRNLAFKSLYFPFILDHHWTSEWSHSGMPGSWKISKDSPLHSGCSTDIEFMK